MSPKVAIPIASLALIAVWWFWPGPDVLNESEYDVAIALYRVCNQSSEEGLGKIESMMGELLESSADSPLYPIIAQAKAGQWQAATESCRHLLDEQVNTARP